MDKIQVGIVGYGNLGKGVEKGLEYVDDMELFGIFSRRDPDKLDTNSKAYRLDDIGSYKDTIDVLVLCGGSAKDIPDQGPRLARDFSTVDAYDNHDLMVNHYQAMDPVARENKKTSIIGTGWDPGLFSINRLYAEAVLPQGQTYTFWGRGLSQGHSDAVRRVEGVKYASQYTIPNDSMVEDIRQGKSIDYSSTTAHERHVYLVLEDEADKDRVEKEIVNMPDYFKGYKTRLYFISEEEYMADHRGMSHGGRVIRRGKTDQDHMSIYEFSLDLDSNPQFTGSVNIAYARAAYRLNKKGHFGALTVADIPPALLSPRSSEDIISGLI